MFADYLSEPGALTRLGALLAETYASMPQAEIDRMMAAYGPGLDVRGHVNPLTGVPQFDPDEHGNLVVMWGSEVFDRIDPKLLISDDPAN